MGELGFAELGVRVGVDVNGVRHWRTYSITSLAGRDDDRFSITVDDAGILTINTGKITLGPLPVALGQPGQPGQTSLEKEILR